MFESGKIPRLLLVGFASSSVTSFQPTTFLQPNKRLLAAAFTSRRMASSSAPDVVVDMTSPPASYLVGSTESYKQILQKLNTISQLERTQAVLNYDQLVFMPASASAQRGAQLSALAGVVHEKSTDPTLLPLIAEAQTEVEPGSDAYRLLEIESKQLRETARVSADLAQRAAELSSRSYAEWVEARQKDDFASYADTLKECFDTAVETAVAKRGDATYSVYTQMLDEFETGMPQDRIDEIFGTIQDALVPLIRNVQASEHEPSKALLEGTYDIDKQKEMNQEIVTSLGFDSEKGRIDVSVHPFTSSFSSSDVRITSRFREDEWFQGLAGTIHEGGHAMYEQNVPDSPYSIDKALSMGTHESQSLFWERHIGLSESFCSFLLPKLQSSFPEQFSGCTARQLYEAINSVTPSLIRVEADELTYPLHVILRYNIERDVVNGALDAKDIPSRWNAEMKNLLGVDVPNDAKGCLQDIHWPSLAIGYFPTYLIGSTAAAQLAYYCAKDLGCLDTLIESGEFSTIKEWLARKVHVHGKRYVSLDALLEDQVGEKLNPKYFLDYLKQKYSDIYKL